ncbi:MAG: FecCD family ABC transporter permease [Candidatus Rifleibacteriota bacterium]
MSGKNYRIVIPVLMLLLMLSAVFSLRLGTIDISFEQIISALQEKLNGSESQVYQIVIQIRLPRIIAAMIAGAALAVSGAAYQSMFINPLVSPGLLGVLAGAGFGSALGVLFGRSLLLAQIGAFVFGSLAVIFALLLARLFQGNRLIMLLIGGIVSSSFFTALISILKYMADPQNELPAVVTLLLGGFSNVSVPLVTVVAALMIPGLLVIIMMSGYLNILSMGDDEASTLGVRVNLVRNILIAATTMVCSLTVSLGGMISWVGLMIPHIARMMVGPDNRRLVPASALLGAVYLLLVDDLCRAATSTEIPVGIMTALIGVPFFVLILWKTDRRWN